MKPYTGNSDVPAKGLRPGTKEWINQVINLSDGALWNNGDFGVRDMRSKSEPSVHGSGRAVDLSYRKMPTKGKANGRKHAVDIMRILVEFEMEIGLEAILDYFPKPWGRGWRCDRGGWSRYKRKTISGAPGGDWIHCEISPEFADDPKKVREGFAKVRAALENRKRQAG
jgi:hypothetical protein